MTYLYRALHSSILGRDFKPNLPESCWRKRKKSSKLLPRGFKKSQIWLCMTSRIYLKDFQKFKNYETGKRMIKFNFNFNRFGIIIFSNSELFWAKAKRRGRKVRRENRQNVKLGHQKSSKSKLEKIISNSTQN